MYDRKAMVTQAIEDGISSLPVFDPFQEIDPMDSYVSFEEHREHLTADREYAECFFVRNGLEKEKREGIADGIYYIESVEESNKDQDGNAFEICDDENSEDDM